MTVGVAAADRMVTWGLTEFEHEEPKLNSVTDRAVILASGDALRAAKVIRGVKAELPAGVSVEKLSELTTEQYCKQRDQQVELEQFRSRGLTREKFYRGESQPLQAQHFFGIDQFVLTYNWNVELLVVGLDEDGSHLFSVGHPAGTMHDWSPIGFHAIGTGGVQAIQSMIGFSHSSRRTLAETVFAVYASKKRAEAAPGVGKDTDLAIISQNGVRRLTQIELAELEKAFQNYVKPVSKETLDQVSDLLEKRKNAPIERK